MQELDIGLPSCYASVYKKHHSSNLVITFTPTNGFFLYESDLNAHKICISTKQPNYYIFNPGNACKKIANHIKSMNVKNIILIGSSKAGLASLIWGSLFLKIFPKVTMFLYFLSVLRLYFILLTIGYTFLHIKF